MNWEFGMRNGECGIGNLECGMGSAEWGIGNGELGMRNGECGMSNSNVEWEKMKKQKYDLEDRLLEHSVFSLFFVGRPVLFERSSSKKGVIL